MLRMDKQAETEDAVNVLCVGLTVVDMITTVKQYPEEDADQRGISFRKQRGGNASNTSTVLSQLNTPCEYLGVLPPTSDPEHRWLQEDFEHHGIKISSCVQSDTPCPMASVTISQQTGSRTIIFCDNGHPELKYCQFTNSVGNRLSHFSWIHFELRSNVEDYLQMLEAVDHERKAKSNSLQNAAELCSAAQPTVSVEIEKPDLVQPERVMTLADVVFISKDWARSRGRMDMCSTVSNIRKLCRPDSIVVCPWAEAGAAAWHNGEIFTASASTPGAVVDTLGAGDTFVAGFIHARLHHRATAQALDYACGLAATKCTMHGFEGLQHLALSHVCASSNDSV